VTALALFMQMAQQPDATNNSFIMFGCVLFAVCLMLYVFMPPTTVETGEEKTRLMFLQERKEVVYENLRDLNFEYKAGKLSDQDFQTMRAAMEEEAAAVLAEIDQLEAAAPAYR
jgi:hypothetical protein